MRLTHWAETNCSFLLNEQARKQQALIPSLWRRANARDISVRISIEVNSHYQLIKPSSLWLVCWNKTILEISKRLTLLFALRLYKSTILKAETVTGWLGRECFKAKLEKEEIYILSVKVNFEFERLLFSLILCDVKLKQLKMDNVIFIAPVTFADILRTEYQFLLKLTTLWRLPINFV